jgi:hypothetical protein
VLPYIFDHDSLGAASLYHPIIRWIKNLNKNGKFAEIDGDKIFIEMPTMLGRQAENVTI